MPETLYDLQISEDLTFPLIIKELNEHRKSCPLILQSSDELTQVSLKF